MHFHLSFFSCKHCCSASKQQQQAPPRNRAAVVYLLHLVQTLARGIRTFYWTLKEAGVDSQNRELVLTLSPKEFESNLTWCGEAGEKSQVRHDGPRGGCNALVK
jgi:hypothetical protein